MQNMRKDTSIDLNFKNFAKFDNLPKGVVKSFVKKNIYSLQDYSLGEEDVLLCLALDWDKTTLALAREFDRRQLRQIKRFLLLRKKGMPLNKIAKKAYFYLDEFYINNSVLAPRKETEILVEKAVEFAMSLNKKDFCVLDMCCGSGVIGLSIAKHANSNRTCLVDVSEKALKITRKNAKDMKLLDKVEVLKGNMFNDLKRDDKFDIIVSNPPYIKSSEIKNLDMGVKKYDPILALDGGKDGLDFYRKIANNFRAYLKDGGALFLEIGFDQLKDVGALFEDKDCKIISYKDYSGNDRVVEVRVGTN